MNSDLIFYLYFALIATFLVFVFVTLFYIFNQKVLSKANLCIKICSYLTLLTFLLMLCEYLVLDYYSVNPIGRSKESLFLIIIFAIYILLVFLVLYINLLPIYKIIRSTEKIKNGKNSNVVITGSKEFEKIQENIDDIEQKNQQQAEYNLKLKKEYLKFIPQEFFTYLGKKEIFDMKLGENVQKDVTVLFIDIRHSYKTSETISLEENFKFINKYLSVVGKTVRENNGFIDKFLGDGVLAVFLKEEDAINCSTQLSNKFANINLVSLGEDKIKFGIGLHSGKVVIGIVGEDERVTPTVISDSVNLAYKIESLNKVFMSKVLFTKEILNNLPKNYELNYRYVGTVSIDDIGITIFENLDAYNGSNKTAYIKTKNMFETAVRNYEDKNYKVARKLFIDVIKYNEEDNLAKFYLKKCKIQP